MILSNEIKENIKIEYETWFNEQYGNKSLEERRKLGAFFTPPELTIKMIEKFETLENKTILDPTCGTGNLLAACVIAGANPTLIYGNEYDPTFVQLCKKRLSKLGVPEDNIHEGDALNPACLMKSNFRSKYSYQEVCKQEQLGSGLTGTGELAYKNDLW